MPNVYYITNRTGDTMMATLSDSDTGNNVMAYQLHPGVNEVNIENLLNGAYIIHLEDNNHEVIYEQTILKGK